MCYKAASMASQSDVNTSVQALLLPEVTPSGDDINTSVQSLLLPTVTSSGDASSTELIWQLAISTPADGYMQPVVPPTGYSHATSVAVLPGGLSSVLHSVGVDHTTSDDYTTQAVPRQLLRTLLFTQLA